MAGADAPYLRKWRKRNPGKAAAYCLAWRKRNPRKVVTYSRAYKVKHRAESVVLISNRQWEEINARVYVQVPSPSPQI